MGEQTDHRNLKEKIEITMEAVSLYEQRDGNLTFHDIARQTDYSVAQIFNHFSKIDEVLLFYYESLVIRYEAMIEEIDDFGSYTLSEKLSNFIYASFDLMSENESFVRATFKPMIVCNLQKTNYQKRIQNVISGFIKNDDMIPGGSSFLLNKYYFNLLQHKYLRLVVFWLNDDSNDKEITLELTDKLTGFLQETLYTSIVDRGIDLVKFAYTNNVCLQNSFFNKISSTFKIR